MIIFHEGLPGSGKSYEALVKHIIPSLQKGRKVYARLNGFNHEKVSELTGKTVDELKDLYTEITEEQVHTVYDLVENDSLLVLDELQNFFPSGRQKLSDEMTQFIAEHRHRGMDIICMGQALADCHTTWKRRIERKITFLKLSMLGMDKKYKWEMYQGSINGAKGDVVFKKVKSGTDTYDSKYFGSYLSHQQTTGNTDVYSDDRVNIFKTKQFMFYIPIFIGVIAFALYYLVGFFNGDSQVVKQPVKEPINGPVAKVESREQIQTPIKQKPKSAKSENTPVRYSSDPYENIRQTIQNNSALITYEEIYKGRVVDLLLVIENSNKQILDKFTRDELLMLGYRLKKSTLGIEAFRGDTLAAVFRYKPIGKIFNNIPDESYQDLYTQE
ncbi:MULTISPECIES: zonular occludens toxin domain-containing protein [unclassified Pseudoalteromonas]|uniref:zonular occludens toxin domain-containing protein n=1 Tax=unclassified Pseudoalteromonas TaxID=194690 RepID=UPI00041E4D91|nr:MULTISPECIES: zonular occludens toxin domain-containing protein [unclassified Pseudoalteromonas]TMP78583.1 Zonular occludens toxin [Pseudoalteromonas sp. S983]